MIKDYEIIEKIYESANSLVFRATQKQNNQPIILKILKENYPVPSEINRYKQEYEITRSLNVDNIIKAYDLQRYENSLAIILEDFGGQSLKKIISQNQLTVQEFFTIGIKTIESLAEIHAANIIHKDINSSNIVYNLETKELKIIDFGVSSRLSQEFLPVYPPSQLEGTLAYIAPEQTGRMNRGIDYRSDFYSLGVTFYELLTNKLPFETTDPMELVHCHIAQQPFPVHKIIPEIPLSVSNIVSKLLAKNPEDRYQSAWGIKADLEICLNQLKSQGQISPFPLGSQDITEKFHIPQKLYGRELEITQLLTAFEQVSQGTTGMILISGYSGIGKSALVNEIHKPITRQRGYFIKGKFDQLQRDIPYSAIAQAFQDLIHKLLSESEARLQTWKKKILEAVGNNGQIIIDVIPEVEKVTGQQPPVEELGTTQNQNRFNLLFQRFLNIFCQKEHPLVMFIDDLQWADLASLNLIEQLISNLDNQYFLLIGAYRNNEVSPTHPLIYTLEKINQAKISVNQITLSPLNIKHINQLITDTLNCSSEYAKPLAELIAEKTAGNPFFLNQLLYSLYQEKLIVFNSRQTLFNIDDNKSSCWQWDIDKIKSTSITDNVVDLMISKIKKLDPSTQEILKLAACIGNTFNLEILSIVNNKSLADTARDLQHALDEGLIIPLDNNYKVPLLWNYDELSERLSEVTSICSTPIYYKFRHDKVQSSAYSLISETEKKPIHLQIGTLLLNRVEGDALLQKKIFDIANHLNKGSTLIIEQTEKNRLAQLNLQAGKSAQSSNAYKLASKYFNKGLQLLANDTWKNQYQLTLELYLKILENSYLNNDFKEIEEISLAIAKQAKGIFDLLKMYQIKALYYYTTFQPQKAIDTAIEILPELGIHLSLEANEITQRTEIQKEFIELTLENKSIGSLAKLPAMVNEQKLASIPLIQQVLSASNTVKFALFIELVLTLVSLCLKYGNPPQASLIYSYYGMLLCGVMGKTEDGYQFGELSIRLLEKNHNSELRAEVFFLYYGYIWCWKNPINDKVAQAQLLHGLQQGMSAGHNEYVGLLTQAYCTIKFLGGCNLEEIEQDYEKYILLVKKLYQEYSINFLNICKNITRNLINTHYSQDCLLIDNSEDSQNTEDEYIQEYVNQNQGWLLFIYYFGKTFNFYFFKFYSKSLDNSKCAEKYVNVPGGALALNAQHNFFFSLASLAFYSYSNPEQQEELLKQVEKNQTRMEGWTEHCPETFQHKYDLVEAEKARILGQNWQAEEFYEKAIQGAKKYEFIHEEALAYERAAEFYLVSDRQEIGQLYLRNAHHCYSRWGAKAKVKQLEEEYPEYLLGGINQSKSTSLSTTISSTGSDGEILDLGTIIKASQAISGEIKLDKLLQNLMKIAIENAGAQTGFLILNNQGNWVIEAQGIVEQEQVTVLQSIPINSINSQTSIPILPTTVINYVARTQEYLVLNNAVDEGQFINDPYIIATQSKSILCTPLLNQGQLSGIVYLENNLTTGAFTSERIELLNILSAQAAISIDNSRLYQTLEQRVEERTKELSQTLDVLKATQQELIFENDLLRSTEQTDLFDYQVGGSLAMDSPTYVVRSADRNLYKALKQGEFCYILNARQMGKSSLMVRMMNHLNQEELSCGAIDMTRIGSENVTPEQWYKGIAMELWRSFDLFRKVNLKTWWNDKKDLPPVQRLSQFIEEILLVLVEQEDNSSATKIVIFIDEIDCVLGLDFPVNDFFALIRSCYNQRTIDRKYQRLTIALFGVATPSELISDRQKTPFNIGQAIQLEGFKEHEAQPLLYGFTDKLNNPQVLLKEVLNWTGGQPFLTQKLCKLMLNSAIPIPINQEAEWIANLVKTKMIDDWEFQDEPEHFKTIRDRILKSEYQPQKLLEIYQQILDNDTIESKGGVEESELLLSGLIIKQQQALKVHNRIYKLIFNSAWLKENAG